VAGSADITNSPPPSSLPAVLGLIFVLFIISSCALSDVLVVEDPYIGTITGSGSRPFDFPFTLKALLAGFRTRTIRLDDLAELPGLFSQLEDSPDWIVLSPLGAAGAVGGIPADARVVIAGGLPPSNLKDRVYALASDRTGAMEEAGSLAADFAKGTGKPVLAIFNAGTEVQKKELEYFLKGVGEEELALVDLSVLAGRVLPDDISGKIRAASVMILMAGPENIPALAASEEESVPVVTEYLRGGGAWKNRIVASIEDGPMEQALLELMKSDTPQRVHYFPARMVRGELYGNGDR
jgi:hypothetical protein